MYTVYHIPGVKVGGSERVEARVKEQGFTYYEVLEVCNTERELSEREIYWQEQLGYGRDSIATYQQTRRAGLYARKPEAKAKVLATRKLSEKWKASRHVERMHTAEARKKSDLKHMRPILQFDIQGNFIKEWPSAKDIMDTIGIHRCGVWACCTGKYKTSKGFIWKYKN